jgi:AcrR family transcriptional regulator
MAELRAKAVSSRNGIPVRRRIDVGSIRRNEIIDAAATIIANEGIQNLSLSEIEARTGMSRGQLTYYFPEKEQILLAVFDRTVARMRTRVADQHGELLLEPTRHMAEVLDMIMNRPMMPEFVGLQYTFLAQTSRRADYRQRLANLYDHWRAILMKELDSRPGRKPKTSSRTRASLFQAVAHGLAVQLVAEPKAFDRDEMMTLCRQLFAMIVGSEAMAKRGQKASRAGSLPRGHEVAKDTRRKSQTQRRRHD